MHVNKGNISRNASEAKRMFELPFKMYDLLYGSQTRCLSRLALLIYNS